MIQKKYKYPYIVNNEKAGLEVKDFNEMNNDELFLLKQARLDSYKTIEAWAATGTNTQINYATHGLFRYFGKFPSTIATHLIYEYTKENDWVMDPMSGSGTTAVECLLSRRNCHSFDVSPLSILLADVKTTKLSKDKLQAYLNKIEENYKPLDINSYDWQPRGIKNIDHWFLPETQDSIRGLLFEINKIDDLSVKNFFLICLSASIRTVSRATTQQGRLFLDVVTAKQDCLETFIKKAKKGIECVASLPEKEISIDIGLHNSFDSFDKDIKNNLIIVHPPYFNSYKYSAINSLELSWMKINHADVRKQEIREFFKVGKAENADKYVNDMTECLNSISKTLNKNSVLALMIGDTIIKGEYVPVTRMVIDKFLENNKNVFVEKIVLRIPKFTEASWTASQRRKGDKVGINLYDFIVIFRGK